MYVVSVLSELIVLAYQSIRDEARSIESRSTG